MHKFSKILGIFCLSSLIGVTSCDNDTRYYLNNPYNLNEHIALQKQHVIFAKTTFTFPATREYYEKNIKTVKPTDTIDGNFRAIGSNVRIIDGDTVHLDLPTSNGKKLFKIRFANVNTPELHHPNNGCDPWGLAAKQYLEVLYEDAQKKNLPVVIESPTVDGKSEDASFDRYLGYVWIGEHLTNIELVEIGLGTMEHANDTNENGEQKYRHDHLAREANIIRTDINKYPSSFNYGVLDFKFDSGLRELDPNWDQRKNNGKSFEDNPAVINKKYKYIFDFTKSGLKSELQICIEKPEFCE